MLFRSVAGHALTELLEGLAGEIRRQFLGADLQQEGGHGSENSCRACRESMEWLAVRRAGAQAQGAGLPSGLMRCSHRERPSAKAFARFSPSPTGFVMTMTPAAGGTALRAGSDQGENKAPAVANGRTAAETLKEIGRAHV